MYDNTVGRRRDNNVVVVACLVLSGTNDPGYSIFRLPYNYMQVLYALFEFILV